jgi:hypothetical protein
MRRRSEAAVLAVRDDPLLLERSQHAVRFLLQNRAAILQQQRELVLRVDWRCELDRKSVV